MSIITNISALPGSTFTQELWIRPLWIRPGYDPKRIQKLEQHVWLVGSRMRLFGRLRGKWREWSVVQARIWDTKRGFAWEVDLERLKTMRTSYRSELLTLKLTKTCLLSHTLQ